MVVLEYGGGSENLRVNTSFDKLSRTDVIDAEYFAGSEAHEIVDYNYFGPSRIQTKTFGNDAVTSVVYDGKRRISEYTTRDATMAQNLLVGYEYDYDDVDNPLWQQTKHDNDYFEEYNYDNLYRLTNVIYRDNVGSPIDYRTYGGSWTPTGGAWGEFNYDALGNRTSSTDGDPFGTSSKAATVDTYTINSANEYTQINRDSTNMNPAYDAAGNMTAFPTRPGSGVETGNDVSADAIYDAFNQALEIEAGSNERHHYRYDALGRRIVAFERGGTASTPEGHVTGEGYQNYELGLGRRYIFDGSRVVTERTFEPGSTLAEVICELERIHVGSILFTAIDADTDGAAAETCLDMTGNVDYAGGLASPPSDVSFYYYTNAFGRVAAYACKHSSEVIYEYLVHRAFGEVVYLGVLDNGTSPGTASDKKEDTITTLGDNNAEMLTAQSSHAPARRVSLIGATYVTGKKHFSSVCGLRFQYVSGDINGGINPESGDCHDAEGNIIGRVGSLPPESYDQRKKRERRESNEAVREAEVETEDNKRRAKGERETKRSRQIPEPIRDWTPGTDAGGHDTQEWYEECSCALQVCCTPAAIVGFLGIKHTLIKVRKKDCKWYVIRGGPYGAGTEGIMDDIKGVYVEWDSASNPDKDANGCQTRALEGSSGDLTDPTKNLCDVIEDMGKWVSRFGSGELDGISENYDALGPNSNTIVATALRKFGIKDSGKPDNSCSNCPGWDNTELDKHN